MEEVRDMEAEDIITPKHPLFKRMEKNGTIEDRARGRGPTEDVLYATPDRSTKISLSQDMKSRDRRTTEGYTRAKYDYIMRLDHLTIPLVEYLNAQGPLAVIDIVKRKKAQVNKNYRNKLVDVVWNGDVNGSETVFGITDFVQTDTSSNPSDGNVGGIDQTIATDWKNSARDFNAAYKTVASGIAATTLPTQSGTSMLRLFEDCSSLDKGDMDEGRPDLMPCNFEFFQRFTDLVDLRIVFHNKVDDIDLGVEGIQYRGATIFFDASVPDEASGEGVCYFLNTNSFSLVFAEGLREVWSDVMDLEAVTAVGWEQMTQYSMTIRNRKQNGVIHGVKVAA